MQQDMQDDFGGEGSADDWFDQHAPAPPAHAWNDPRDQPSAVGVGAPGNATNAIQGYYTHFLGREATAAEIQSHLQNPGGLGAVQNLIANSPEAMAYAKAQQQTAQPAAPTPRPATGSSSTASVGGFGGPVAAFDPASAGVPGGAYPTYTPPALPADLQRDFRLPSALELQTSPGYLARYQQGLDARQRSAAAQGTILNGGTQKALDRYGQDYAQNSYNDLVGQKLNERQQQSQDYLNLAYGPAWQSNQAAVNQYGTLYNQYRNLIGDNRNAQNDYWSHQVDLLNAGLNATKAGAPGAGGPA